jgi:hypothetical protein
VALADLQRAREYFARQAFDVGVATALEPGTLRSDADRILKHTGITLTEIPLTPAHFAKTEARNQIPTTLLFRDGTLIDRHLGPPSFESLKAWIEGAQKANPQHTLGFGPSALGQSRLSANSRWFLQPTKRETKRQLLAGRERRAQSPEPSLSR